MSLYVQWLNQIKEQAAPSWLTEAQRAAYDRLLSQWGSSQFVNLCGPTGCGKSFVGRLLAKEHDYAYTHDLEEAPSGSPNVVLDDAEYTRLLRPVAQARKLGRVILLTRHPVRDPMPRAQIRLTERDVAQFQHNLYIHCGISFYASTPKGTNLAQIIHAEVVARGGTDVSR